MKNARLIVFPALAFFLLSCSDKMSSAPEPVTTTNLVDPAAIDASVSPCEDFYAYACGSWIKNTEIPAGYTRWYRSFSGINEENINTIKTLLEDYSQGKNTEKLAAAKKLGAYYAACMDEKGIETNSAALLPQYLAKIQAVNTKETLAALIAEFETQGVASIFNFYADQDYQDATRVIGVADRPSLGLPEKDYYLNTGEKKTAIRKAYLTHVENMLLLSGLSANTAKAKANWILTFETELAKNMLSLEERRDPSKIYHLINRPGLEGLTPSFAWSQYFEKMGIPAVFAINVAETEYFRGLETILNNTSLEDLKIYLQWRFVHALSETLSSKFDEESFAFYGKTLKGQKEQQPRWKRCVNAANALGEGLGEAYVGLKFSEEAKANAKEMISNIRLAVEENFKSIEWMDAATKAKAIEKLSKITPKIGYPDKWKDYSALQIDAKSYLTNTLATANFESTRNLAKIGKPVDKTEWGMFPHTVNAYYNPTMNEIVFPAAILQSPFYNVMAPTAANYGAVGMVMGHEITHGFDDEGRSFDGDGNLKDWWSASVATKFEERAQCLVDQYNTYTVSGGVHLNGKLTLGENIADLGGLKLSWLAYQKAKQQGAATPTFAELTADQQFFLSFAQGWCAKVTPETEQLQAQTDPHSAAQYRVNGVVVNSPQFAEAFKCAAGTKMAPVKRCTVW